MKEVDGIIGPSRSKMTWKTLRENDCHEWKLTTVNPKERSPWRSGVRSAMCAASQLLEAGPLMWMMPLHLHVNKKSEAQFNSPVMHVALFCNCICRDYFRQIILSSDQQFGDKMFPYPQ